VGTAEYLEIQQLIQSLAPTDTTKVYRQQLIARGLDDEFDAALPAIAKAGI
jgi:hypothetical protein